MQGRITGYMTPEQLGHRLRRIQYKLPTQRVPEHDATVNIRPVSRLNLRQQLILKKRLKVFRPAPVVTFDRRRCKIGRAILPPSNRSEP